MSQKKLSWKQISGRNRKEAIAKGEKWAIELFFKYKYGMPKQSIEQNNTHTMNDFNIKDLLKFDNPKP